MTYLFFAFNCVAIFASPNNNIGVKQQLLPITISKCNIKKNKMICYHMTNHQYLYKKKPYGTTVFVKNKNIWQSKTKTLYIAKNTRKFSLSETDLIYTKKSKLVHFNSVCYGYYRKL